MMRSLIHGLLGCLILCCSCCVENIVYYPPKSDTGNANFFVIVDNKPIGRHVQEVFVSVYGHAGNVYALREFEIPVEAKDTLRWSVKWESLDKLKIVFHTYKYTVGHDKLMTRDIEPYHVFTLSLGYDAQLGTFVETPESDIPVQKWQT